MPDSAQDGPRVRGVQWNNIRFAQTMQNGAAAVLAGDYWGSPLLAAAGEFALMVAASAEHSPSVQRWHVGLTQARFNPPSRWRNWDIRYLNGLFKWRDNVVFTHRGLYSHDVVAALEPLAQYIDQPILDWLTLRDVAGITCDAALRLPEQIDSAEAAFDALKIYDADEAQLLAAFSERMIAQAEASPHLPPVGLYAMKRTPLAKLDNELIYDGLRVYIAPKGIAASFTAGDMFFPVAYLAESADSTSYLFVHGRASMAINAMLSCMWRDAKVVTERWAQRGHKSAISAGKAPEKRDSGDKVVRLPRTVYRATWGQPGDRLTARTTRAHVVRGCYTKLPDGWQSRYAEQRAETHGFPAPPPGYNFRAPHIRGEGTPAQAVPRLVCEGLLVAHTILN